MVPTVFEEAEILEGTETCPQNLSLYLQSNHELAMGLPSNQSLWAVLGERLTEKTPWRVSAPKVRGRKNIHRLCETPLENSPCKTFSSGWERSRKAKEVLDFCGGGKEKSADISQWQYSSVLLELNHILKRFWIFVVQGSARRYKGLEKRYCWLGADKGVISSSYSSWRGSHSQCQEGGP